MMTPSATAPVVLLVVSQVGGRERGVHGAAPAGGAQAALGVRGDGVVELEHCLLHLVLHGLRTSLYSVHCNSQQCGAAHA